MLLLLLLQFPIKNNLTFSSGGEDGAVKKRVSWFKVTFYPLNTWKLFEKFQKKKQRFQHFIKLTDDS